MDLRAQPDAKDIALVSILRQNSRQSIKTLARALHISKDTARYRMKRLEERGIIKRYMAHLDYSALGFQSYRTYIKLQHTTPEIDAQIYSHIKKITGVRIMGRFEGAYSFGWVAIARTPYQYSLALEEFLRKFSKYVQHKEVNLIVEQRRLALSYAEKRVTRDTEEVYEQSTARKIDEKDTRILEMLFTNARIPLTELAVKTKLTARTVHDRIKRLRHDKLIVSFGLDMDLGLTYYKLMINLEDTNKLPRVYSFAHKNHKTIGAVFRTLGGSDCELDIYTSTFQEFLAVLDALKEELKTDLKNYSYHTITQLFIPQTLDLHSDSPL